MKKGDYIKAEEFYRKAFESNPDNSRYQLLLGWCIFQNPDNASGVRMEGALEHLVPAVENEEGNADAHYYVAKYYKESGQSRKCRDHLEKAVSIRRSFIEAKRELRLMEMRSRSSKDATSNGDSGWSFFGLFKRKK
jgi:tetratricopeptide (TPR) repeat protein